MSARPRLVLASGSQPRLRLLRAAGFDPEVVPSDVDEDGVDGLAPEKAAVALAERKARAVADRLAGRGRRRGEDGAGGGSGAARPSAGPGVGAGMGGADTGAGGEVVVVGCDTVVTMDGRVYGKPASIDQARAWVRHQRGRWVDVVTGQCAIVLGTGQEASAAAWTGVEIGAMSDEELEDYLATGEALDAAGALTVDGYGAPFVTGLRGDHGTVVGLSLPLLRDLLAELGISITSLWAGPEGRRWS